MTLPEVGPAVVLALIVGTFHSCLYVLIRGSGGGRFVATLAAAVLGAYGGQALGLRLGDPLRIGDFGLLYSSLLAWVGIAVVAVVSVLAVSRTRPTT